MLSSNILVVVSFNLLHVAGAKLHVVSGGCYQDVHKPDLLRELNSLWMHIDVESQVRNICIAPFQLAFKMEHSYTEGGNKNGIQIVCFVSKIHATFIQDYDHTSTSLVMM